MRKALNFDIDTKEYEKCTKKKSPKAYYEIKKYLEDNGFEHRQGSGYTTKESVTDEHIAAIVVNMSQKFKWMQFCMREIDVTNIEKQYSMLYFVKSKKETKEEVKNNRYNIRR